VMLPDLQTQIQMKGELKKMTGNEEPRYPYCPEHIKIATDNATSNTEIKNLVIAHQQLYGAVNELRSMVVDKLDARVQKWVLLVISILVAVSTGLIVNYFDH